MNTENTLKAYFNGIIGNGDNYSGCFVFFCFLIKNQ